MYEIITRSDAKLQQQQYYFTGKPCKHGHLALRRTRDGKCKDCDLMYGASWRKENPNAAAEWRKENPDYAKEKYQENREERLKQSHDWYVVNREHALLNHKKWYYDPANEQAIKQNRKDWYEKNPDYDSNYYYKNHTHMCEIIKPAQRARYYKKRKAKLHEEFKKMALSYKLPDDPSEHDVKYWLAGVIMKRTGWDVFKEVWLDEERTSRIDLLIPDQQIGIELKINNMYGNSVKTGTQYQRYVDLMPNYDLHLISVDGSVGESIDHFLNWLETKKDR